MRITRSLLLSTLFALVVGTSTANTNPEKTSSRAEIKEMIVDANLAETLRQNVTIHVNFMVNDKNEIIILSTDKKNWDDKIKAVLNYKKLKSTDMQINKTYTLPLVLKK